MSQSKEQKREACKAYYAKNREHLKAYARKYRTTEKARETYRKYRLKNKDRIDRARRKRWANDRIYNPLKLRARYLKARYKLSKEDFERILDNQGGVCPGCGNPNPTHIDHDHACCAGVSSCGECIRGVLCDKCNLGLGAVKDNPDILDALAAYLKRYKERE